MSNGGTGNSPTEGHTIPLWWHPCQQEIKANVSIFIGYQAIGLPGINLPAVEFTK